MEGDQSKLGPLAMSLGMIISDTTNQRRDIEKTSDLIEKKGTKLFIGSGLTK